MCAPTPCRTAIRKEPEPPSRLLAQQGSALVRDALLALDPLRRISAREALTHDFFAQANEPPTSSLLPEMALLEASAAAESDALLRAVRVRGDATLRAKGQTYVPDFIANRMGMSQFRVPIYTSRH